MQILTQNEIKLVAGAGQYLEITERLVVTGIPQNCIANYYDKQKDNLHGLYAEVVMEEIYQECPHELNIQFELFPVSVVLVNY